MKEEVLEKVSLWTSNNYEMDVKVYNANSENLMLYVVGIGGAYGVFGDLLSNLAMQNDKSFLWPIFEDTYVNRLSKKINTNGEIEKVASGATWASLKNLQVEYDSLFKYIKQCGYKNISVVAVCGGCSKLIYYMLKNEEFKKMVDSVVLLAPEDYKLVKIHPKNKGMLEESLYNLVVLNDNKILSKPFMGYMDMSSKTYLEYLYLKKYNTLPYYDQSTNLLNLKNIDMPVKIYMAQLDRAIKDEPDGGIERLTRLTNSFCNAKYEVVNDCVHMFCGKEDNVVQSIADFLNYEYTIDEENYTIN